jgi:agmatine/peptidylarginine deiminase
VSGTAEQTPTRRLPAEWEPVGAVLLAWPRSDGDWKPYLQEVRACYQRLLTALTELVPVLLLVEDRERTLSELGPALAGLAAGPKPRLQVLTSPARDTWTRDYGPITVLERPTPPQGTGLEVPLLLDFRFNGWGGKYDSLGDDTATSALHAAGALGPTALQQLSLVLEGGSIDSDGQGTLLTTSTCLLASTRNPELDRSAREGELRQHLGANRVLWLEQEALAGDDTDAHIDTLVRFCPHDTLAHVADAALQRQLETLRTATGAPYRLVPLPAGPTRRAPDDDRPLPATYANALFLNGTLLLPTYDDPSRDSAAAEAWSQACPGWRILPLDCTALLLQHGSLHCATMQIPAEVFR